MSLPEKLPVRIGILHSLTGITSISEMPLVRAASLAVDEINERGGILGRHVDIVLKDGESTPAVFSEKATELIDEGVCAVFGCWSSASRKAVRPIIEAADSILLYPMQYEGLEQSRNILYTGSCLNQQFVPGVDWALATGRRTCVLVGSDYVYPRTANALVRSLMEAGGGEVLDERYVSLTSTEFAEIAEDIERLRPEIVFSTIAGEGNLSFFRELDRAGVTAGSSPVLSFSFSEIELQAVAAEASGHYACWSYFQSLRNNQNRRFIDRLRRKYGRSAVAAAPMTAAYVQVHLWANTVQACGSTEPSVVLAQACGQSFVGPEGRVEILANNHVEKVALIGRASHDGEFEIVWRSEGPIPPKPWLGAEDTAGPGGDLILRLLGQYPDALHLNWKLAEENRKRKEAEDALRCAMERTEAARNALQRREEVAEGLGGILGVLNSDRSLAELLDYITSQAQQLLGSDGCEVYRVDGGIGALLLEATTITQSIGEGGVAVSSIPGAAEKDLVKGRTLAICDVSVVADGESSRGATDERVSDPRGEAPYSAMLAVPLLVKQDIWGALALFFRNPTHFTKEDVRLAESIGDHAALAIENARLRERASASGAKAERSRLGRELHDSVTQSLFAAALIAEAIPSARPGLDSDLHEQLEDVRRLTRGALAEMRTLLLEARPDGLRDVSAGELLTHLVRAAQSRCLATIDCSLDGCARMPSDVQIALYRTAQEALSNVSRHSMASHATVSLQCRSRGVQMRIQDDGNGFDVGKTRPGHLGLRIMRERAEEVHAHLGIESAIGQGTVVTFTWQGQVMEGQ